MGDLVVLGANAKDRLNVVNGTTAVIVGLEVQQRAMVVRTLEEEPPKTVRLPGWYLDAEVQPRQSRRVDLAYARTDMRSQGLTRQRALLSLDGCEDTQGLYVQLTRARERTDLDLSVNPEPPLAGEAEPVPRRQPHQRHGRGPLADPAQRDPETVAMRDLGRAVRDVTAQ